MATHPKTMDRLKSDIIMGIEFAVTDARDSDSGWAISPITPDAKLLNGGTSYCGYSSREAARAALRQARYNATH